MTWTRTFEYPDDDTCKARWVFTLEGRGPEAVIHDIHIAEREEPVGCQGHPGAVTALLRGRRVGELDVRALLESDCLRGISCGAVLARCLSILQREAR
jgi:hypothetical protein